MDHIELIATAPFGLEAVVAREVKQLGYEDVTVENGRLTFIADLSAICRTNLWLRTADRVLVKMGSFTALTFDELFEQTKALPWDEWIPVDAEFPVQGKSVKSRLFSVPDCQAIVKKAVVEKLKQRYHQEWFAETGPRYNIEVALLKDEATLTIDTSGAGLHKRGYRKLGSTAPLKETLAAALVLLSYWRPERPLIDPLCGSGTIPIEAALIGLNIAPGLGREFAAEKWPVIPASLWKEARVEARHLISHDRELEITGSDNDSEVLSLARHHAEQAGVDDQVLFRHRSLANYSSAYPYGCVITNPPYGERLGESGAVENLYREMGRVFQAFGTWSFYILTAYPGFERLFGRPADRKRKLYNGRIECHYYQFFGPRPPRDLPVDIRQAE
ncbi:MAG: class I SAM-dependent RNA methyltransferase [Firmicutes bacterium]|jgi:putative N6-adenine-specific DNA methylase|nr:class I SAM-dependent RNA methyltransferase [Bacillota bacterium]MBU4553564.1 class I SAM-dependent RNA methyltransferase [Bacillota bacterium]MBV1726747.1 class I SAM-dependent RNA methyltransferase [Desulforudis sp.]MBV1735633.1 class I SAM-dependent RNA methyltransferase [Desulforudis sp.]MBV1769047.1 class I SAM-dependent RNA methyltransferase [Desulforudis sp.]